MLILSCIIEKKKTKILTIFYVLEIKMTVDDTISPIANDTSPPTRRDFLKLATGAMGVIGVAGAVWPFIDSMNPAADVLAQATVDIEIKGIVSGQAITVMWQGKPVFIRRRTPAEISQVRAVADKEMIDPQTDQSRVQSGKDEWLVVVGICTHLGCVPVGQKMSDNRGDYGGWFCPCHGSEYDASGRVRRGPAPKNLVVPPYFFLNDNTLRIGQEHQA